jgi:hypothetical protein
MGGWSRSSPRQVQEQLQRDEGAVQEGEREEREGERGEREKSRAADRRGFISWDEKAHAR